MRKAITKIGVLSAALISLTIAANAQWSQNPTSVYLTNASKNVGIGTSTPAFSLDVYATGSASANFKSANGNSNLIIDRGNNSATSSVSYRTNGSPTWQTGTMGTDNFAIRNIALGKPAIVVDNATNNVGIGTNSASTAFAVGQNKFNVASDDGDLTFSDQLGSITFPVVSGANAPMIQMFASGTSNLDRMVIAHSSGFSTYGLQYQDASDKFNFIGNGSPVLTADLTNLRVGIGTLTPTQKLHVIGNAIISGTITSGSDAIVGGNLDVTGYVGFGSVEQLTDGGANTIASNSSFVPTTDAIRSLGTSALRWNNVWAAGSVGIGVTSASTKLHVDGGTDVSPASGGYFTIGDIAGLNIGFDDNEIMARSNGATSPLYLQNSGGNLIMCNASGNVTIGTSVPAAGYILSVDGKVMAEEVRVELSGNWPDYVFSKEHNLMSIEALENHVNEFKHLPGIPSAKEVEAQGISLGQMQTKTIEKLEENSLYIIQLNNKIESQNAVIAKLIKELEDLKNNK